MKNNKKSNEIRMLVHIKEISKKRTIQTWPHDSPVEGEEPYLFWGH
jgi:hypothetical protein